MNVTFASTSLDGNTLRQLLEEATSRLDSATELFEGRQFRGLPTEIVVALAGGTGVALAALLTGVTALLRERFATGRIVIEGRHGKVEVPANLSEVRIEKLVALARELDEPRVEILIDE